MSRTPIRGGLLAGAAMLTCALPAAAQVSAEALWADWQDAYSRSGGELTAGEAAYADGTLVLRDLAFTSVVGDVETVARVDGEFALAEQADGTVAVTVPDVMTITSIATVEGETVENEAQLTQNDYQLLVSEEGDGRRYDYAATSMIYLVEAPEGAEGDGNLSVAVRGYSGALVTTGDAFRQDDVYESMTLQGYAADQTGEGGATFRYQATGVESTAEGAIPEAPAEGAPFRLEMTGAQRHSGSLIEVDNDGPQPFTFQGGSETGAVEFAATPGSMTIALVSDATTMELALPQLPGPIPFTLASTRTEMQLPLGGTEDASPFGLVLALRDLVVADEVWAAFDPTGQLPRDPITAVIDLDGTAIMTADLLGDPAALAELQGPPGRPETLDLAELLLRFGGAELRGQGSLAFDEAMNPVGTIELALDGGNALLDRLVTLGAVPQQQLLGLRAMLGVVARSVGDDSLASTIEFTEGGGIVANGMQVR